MNSIIDQIYKKGKIISNNKEFNFDDFDKSRNEIIQ